MLASDIWGPIGATVGALAILVGGVLAWWFARGPRLVMQPTGNTLVSAPSDDRITVLYQGHSVPRVTQSIVWLWREGRGTVRGSDVVDTDPIVLRVPAKAVILHAAVVAQTKPTNAVAIAYDVESPRDTATIAFEYLDARQGAVIEVLHTAESPESVEITGTIIGMPKGVARVTSGVEVDLPLTPLGIGISVTVPTHTIPRSLRVASGVRRKSRMDATLTGVTTNVLRRLLP